LSADLSISIGLLWDETIIRGELLGNHLVEAYTLESRQPEVFTATGHFTLHTQSGMRNSALGIRLAESLSHAHAEQLATQLHNRRRDLTVGVLQAGRQWRTTAGTYDARVWWPVVRLEHHEPVADVMNDLRDMSDLDPLALTVVRLDPAEPAHSFSLELARLSRRVGKVTIKPATDEATFVLHEVPIGRGFHWEHKESLEYRGELHAFHPGGKGITVANRLPLETYLQSTVSSEMRSDLPPAFSQAQAIAARSTVLATAGRHHYADGFDLCNDDHCQCYQGVIRENEAVMNPVRETAGQILTASSPPFTGGLGGVRVVDARYAKSCGGVSERYEAAWGGEGPDYFAIRPCGEYEIPDLSDETQAREFLQSSPPAWCNGKLHPYPEPWSEDPLFRWHRRYTREQLGAVVEKKTGKHIGSVRELKVIQRGKSGRILILDILGTEGSLRAYGELNIRRALSDSHLPSSYFIAETTANEIILKGGGWGHGVGLCQLGAAAMAKSGKSVEEILGHYYPNTAIELL
jgi:SpoIID/LytB domain protein